MGGDFAWGSGSWTSKGGDRVGSTGPQTPSWCILGLIFSPGTKQTHLEQVEQPSAGRAFPIVVAVHRPCAIAHLEPVRLWEGLEHVGNGLILLDALTGGLRNLKMQSRSTQAATIWNEPLAHEASSKDLASQPLAMMLWVAFWTLGIDRS